MKKFAGLILFFLGAFSGPVMAQESPWASADYLQARLISATTAVETGNPAFDLKAGLEIRLGEGWHMYWRMPGEGGLPPRFDWAGSNVEKVDVSWPVPERFETAGFYSVGYEDSVLFPLTVHVSEVGKPVTLGLKAEIMVCNDICVPQKLELSLAVPQGAAKETSYARQIADSFAKVPGESGKPQLQIENVVVGPEAIVVTAHADEWSGDADLFVESGDLYIASVPEVTVNPDDPHKAMIRVAAPEGVRNLAQELANTDLTLTLTNGNTAIEKTIPFKN